MTGESVLRLAGPVALILTVGLLSGLVPLINAEALLIAAVVQAHGHWQAVVVAIAFGQSGAKILIFIAARDGHKLIPAHPGTRRTRAGTRTRGILTRWRALTGRWAPHTERVAELIRRPIAGSALILASAIGGIPPLAATSVLAGMAHMRLILFGTTCLTGRLIRFSLIAIPVGAVTT